MEPRPTRELRTVPVSQLVLDRQNPRLVGSVHATTDEAIIGTLYRTAELEELFESVSTNGYLDMEPLIVVRNDNRTLTVLEGNRRLATLRLLTDPDLVTRISRQENIRLSIPSVPPSLSSTLRQVTVYEVQSRDEARAFIGFKHINGPAKWNAYAKAQFAANWYKAIRPARGPEALREVARSIGDRHATIKRMVFAVYVLQQAQATDLFAVDDRYTTRFNFSHLYTALSRSQYMQFLGIKSSWYQYDPAPDSVPTQRLDRLRDVLVWIYGSRSDDVPPVVRVQNPDIKRLGEVLASTEAVHVLRQSRNLDQAHAATEPASTRFAASLLRARDNLRDVANALRGYTGDDRALLDVSEDIKETATSIYAHMKRKLDERNKS